MADLVALKAELLAGHPDTGAYNVDNVLAAAEVNAVNRPRDVVIGDIFFFLLMENTHKTDGTDTQDRAIWTRLKDVVALNITPDGATANPWGSTSIGTITEIQQIKTHQLLDFFTLSMQGNGAQRQVDLTETNFQVYLAGAESAGCLSAAQETALLALGNNLQSRAQELSLGRVREGTVIAARAL